MADDIDVANEQVQKALDATMKTIQTKIEDNNTGKCIWCGDAVPDKRRWCSVECRDEQERHS